jgi:hypothetical protein
MDKAERQVERKLRAACRAWACCCAHTLARSRLRARLLETRIPALRIYFFSDTDQARPPSTASKSLPPVP